MPNVAKVLKEEISRIGRKEAKAAFTPIQRRTIRVERGTAELKRRVALLEKENRQFCDRLAKMEAFQPAMAAAPGGGKKARITAKGVRSLRRKLGLSRDKFAKLVGVTGQAVYVWESKHGAVKLRDRTKTAILSIREFGARDARARLEAMKQETSVPRRGRVKRRRK